MVSSVYADLISEGEELEALVPLDERWYSQTPAPGWTVGRQIDHMAEVAAMARSAAMPRPIAGANGSPRRPLELVDGPEQTVRRWRTEREAAARALSEADQDRDLPWMRGTGRPSLIGAALAMEMFGHGQDIVDTVGEKRTHTDRIGHVVWFGARTRDFGYRAHGFEAPDKPFRFEITAPSGNLWAFGPEDAEQRVIAPAVDFCLLVTCRRHRDDVDVKAIGREAERWLGIAQCYPGPAGAGRSAGQFGGR
ncbi:Wyosine base formation domain protein [Catenulispora acidiphila DSM 44928]|uniref:Wyosine base formation domain protein n=1 Tax=Catenulispora acidiphila (strain DSM 44928 / JCM 14897 / NBRC 102108 / NRRL B-24433 / ID139908) TaxID=479433 RepID=C7QKE4_CATAD|nr:maleylpyruvate isomerase family mycothiol-dependent enzyme [Catenulispora acidiphila]ACU75218.1 Wyosine base formation domain protein [Catenulispora acidiphila DSM 44928]